MLTPTTAREYYLPQLGSVDNLTLHTKSIETPRANEVLIKVHAISLQFLDVSVARGEYPLKLPDNLIPCSDMAGEIVAVGEGVQGWHPGDRVCANTETDHVYGNSTPESLKTSLGIRTHGVLTEYRTFPAHSLVSIPAHLSYEEASTLPCAGLTAYSALVGPVPVKAGDYVLVLGTGGVSIFSLQFAVASGAIVIITSSSDEKLKIASKLGAKHVINYKKTPNWDEEVLKITNGVGVDHVIEVGGQGTLPKSVNATKVGGQLHIIGFVSEEQPNFFVRSIISKVVTLRGIMIGSVVQFAEMNRLLSARPENTRPVIDKVFSFEEAKDAFLYLASQAHVGKVVIRVSKE